MTRYARSEPCWIGSAVKYALLGARPVTVSHVVFVESTEHAYRHIKRLTPHLIIVCLDIDDLDGFQVLSMLKLDEDTKGIPVVTCTMQQEDDVMQDESLDPPDDVFSQPAAMQLN